MKATIEPRDKFNANYRKDSLHRGFKVIEAVTGKTVVDARLYYPGSVAYAAVWINSETLHASGTGKAGGYGYHKESAALGDALENAGVTLSEHIGGRGHAVMGEALVAVARAASSRRNFYLVESHA